MKLEMPGRRRYRPRAMAAPVIVSYSTIFRINQAISFFLPSTFRREVCFTRNVLMTWAGAIAR